MMTLGSDLFRHFRDCLAVLAFCASFAASAGAQAPGGPAGSEPVDVELILMVDASGSVDDHEYELQRLGYAQAFRNRRVVGAIGSGPLGKIAVAYVEWTGPFLQVPIVEWTVLSNPATVEAFAQRLETVPRQLFSGGTAVGHAILYGAKSIQSNAYAGTRRVIDVSGDGPTNRGVPASFARDQAVAQGIVVNGLPILSNFWSLDTYYLDNVVGGPGAFSIPARNFSDIQSAVLTKLIREIAGTPPNPPQGARSPAR